MNRARHDDAMFVLHEAFGEQHRFAKRRRSVVERCVRDVESGQHRLMRLIFEDRLQRSLRHFRLIRRVRRQELGAQQKLIDARRLIVRVRATAEKRHVIDGGLVLRRERAEPAARFDLRPRAGDVEQRRELDVVRDGIEETIDRLDPDHAEHFANVGLRIRNVAMNGLQRVRKRSHKKC